MTSYARAQRRQYGLKLVAWVRTLMLKPHAKEVHWEKAHAQGGDDHYMVKDRVCAKWQPKASVDNCGRTVVDDLGELHPVITCTCGADESNKKVNQVCDELEKLLLEFLPPAVRKPKK